MPDRYSLYRTEWTSAKDVAKALREVADLVEKNNSKEWFIRPVDESGADWEFPDDMPSDYMVTY